MSWEAHRLTSKSPAEVYTVLGPHGCDDLIRQAWAACWREHPEETRTFQAVRQRFFETFTRNLNIWRRIKKPTPEAFFADLKPHDTVEGHLRQAMVLAWMMLPRAGGRTFADTIPLIQRLYARNLAAFEEDNQTFTKGPKKKRPTRPTKTPRKTKKKSTKR